MYRFLSPTLYCIHILKIDIFYTLLHTLVVSSEMLHLINESLTANVSDLRQQVIPVDFEQVYAEYRELTELLRLSTVLMFFVVCLVGMSALVAVLLSSRLVLQC